MLGNSEARLIQNDGRLLLIYVVFEGSIMPELQPLSSIFPLAQIERPACPKCQGRMLLVRIVPAFLGTDLHTFECAACNHVLRTLGAHDDRRGAALS
jgi:hypothetical protein